MTKKVSNITYKILLYSSIISFLIIQGIIIYDIITNPDKIFKFKFNPSVDGLKTLYKSFNISITILFAYTTLWTLFHKIKPDKNIKYDLNKIQRSIVDKIRKNKIKCVNDFINKEPLNYTVHEIKEIENHGKQIIAILSDYQDALFKLKLFQETLEYIKNKYVHLKLNLRLDFNIKFVENYNPNTECDELNDIIKPFEKHEIIAFDKKGLKELL